MRRGKQHHSLGSGARCHVARRISHDTYYASFGVEGDGLLVRRNFAGMERPLGCMAIQGSLISGSKASRTDRDTVHT